VKLPGWGVRILSLVILLGVWEFTALEAHSHFYPTPVEVAEAGWSMAKPAVQTPGSYSIPVKRTVADMIRASTSLEIPSLSLQIGALLVLVVNPLALGLLKSPGELGADIVVGEGQPLGMSLSFGGPYLGFFACRTEYVRKIAGRIVGETLDQDGRRAFVMTLRPREQDIRREKASSNICTNQGLMSLTAAVYLSLMGKSGLRKVAELCYHKAHYAAHQVDLLLGFRVDASKPFFNEFIVKCPRPVAELNALLVEKGILGGIDLGVEYPHLKDHMLIAVTEMNSKAEIDALVEALKETIQ